MTSHTHRPHAQRKFDKVRGKTAVPTKRELLALGRRKAKAQPIETTEPEGKTDK